MKNNYHFIEPVLFTKLHVMNIGKMSINKLLPSLKIISANYNLRLNRVKDFRVAVKLLEDSIIEN